MKKKRKKIRKKTKRLTRKKKKENLGDGCGRSDIQA